MAVDLEDNAEVISQLPSAWHPSVCQFWELLTAGEGLCPLRRPFLQGLGGRGESLTLHHSHVLALTVMAAIKNLRLGK